VGADPKFQSPGLGRAELAGSSLHLPFPGSCLLEGEWVLFLPGTVQRRSWWKAKEGELFAWDGWLGLFVGVL
jgi:hypothetical protein